MGRGVYLKPPDTTVKHAIFRKANMAKRNPGHVHHPGSFARPGDTEIQPVRTDLLGAIGAQRELKRRRYRGSLFMLAKYGLGYPDLDPVAHGPVCRALENAYWGLERAPWHEKGIRKILIMMPRGTLKSTLVTYAFPIWVLLQNDPAAVVNAMPEGKAEKMWVAPPSFNGKKGYNQRILLSNLTCDNAIQFLSTIKAHLSTNEELRDVFGNAAPERRVEGLWKAERCNITWRDDFGARDPNLQTNGLDRSVNSGHFDIGIFDDMIDEKMVNNAQMVERSIQFHRQTQPLLEKPALQIYVGTHWADQDLYTHLRESPEEKGQWEMVIEEADRALGEPKGPPDQVLADGRRRYFFPAKLDGEVLEKLQENLGPYYFGCQYQNNPVTQSTAVFKKNYFEKSLYTLDGMTEYELKDWLATLSIHTTSDPAISKEKTGCQSVIVTCGWDWDGTCWVLDLFAKKNCQTSEFLEEFYRQFTEWDSTSAGIEEVGFQVLYKGNVEQMSRERNVYLPWVELKPGSRIKERRIEKLEPLCRRGQLKFQKRHRQIEAEFIRYPRGKSRDIMDALAYQLDVAFTPDRPEKKVGEPDLNTFEYEQRVAATAMQNRIKKLKRGRMYALDWYDD